MAHRPASRRHTSQQQRGRLLPSTAAHHVPLELERWGPPQAHAASPEGGNSLDSRSVASTLARSAGSELSSATASRRECTPRRRNADERCVFTVLSAMKTVRAICAFVSPARARPSACRSPGANVALSEWPWTDAARRAGLARDAVYLVRPDGHVGWAREAADVEGLRAYLGRFGIVARSS